DAELTLTGVPFPAHDEREPELADRRYGLPRDEPGDERHEDHADPGEGARRRSERAVERHLASRRRTRDAAVLVSVEICRRVHGSSPRGATSFDALELPAHAIDDRIGDLQIAKRGRDLLLPGLEGVSEEGLEGCGAVGLVVMSAEQEPGVGHDG